MRWSYALVILPAAVGAALAVVAYFAPETGVNGTPGALLALIGAAAVLLGGLLAMAPSVRGRRRGVLNLLIGLAAVLTAVAAWFLMTYGVMAAMALAFLGLLAIAAIPSRRRPA